MRTFSKRLALVIAALTATAGGLVFTSAASAAPDGTPPTGPLTLAPLTSGAGGLTTNYTLTPPANASCPGDSSAGSGFSVATFMVPQGQDPAVLTYGVAGPNIGNSLFTASGSPITGANLAPAVAPAVTGRILGLGNLRFEALGTVPDGAYTIGIACVRATQTVTYFSTTVSFASNLWAFGARPAAPALTTSNYDAATTTATVNFTHAASTPATTGYTVAFTGTPARSSQSIAGGLTSFQVTGLTLGQSYGVTLTATNTTGTSGPSNSLTITGAVTGTIAVNAPDAFVGEPFTVSWSPPTFPGGTTPAAPTGYTLTGVGANPIPTSGAPASSSPVCTPDAPATLCTSVPAGLAIGSSYTAAVTANYAGTGVVASGSDGFAITPNTLLYQVITVERPRGALILTQRCNVYGGLPVFGNLPGVTTNAPGAGFPKVLDPIGTVGTTASLPGDAPTVVATGVQDTASGQFNRYPNPANPVYPTRCGVAMNTAELVLEGPMAGAFYTAAGQMNQVTVLDTRDDDLGWIARGDVAADFATGPVGNPTDTFSGNFLGWQPIRTKMTTRPDYLRTGVAAGPVVIPGAGSPGTTLGSGMKDSPLLAQAPGGQGLGIVDLDARLALLIPATADRGVYTARLDLTVV